MEPINYELLKVVCAENNAASEPASGVCLCTFFIGRHMTT